MSDYYPASDSGHVYRSNRERIAKWVQAYGDVELKTPSDPPSPVDEWLGPDGSEEDDYTDQSVPPRIVLRYRDGRPDAIVDPTMDPNNPYYHRSYSRSTSSSDHGHHGSRSAHSSSGHASAPNRNLYSSPMPTQPEQIRVLPARSNSGSSVGPQFPPAPRSDHSHGRSMHHPPPPISYSSSQPSHHAPRHPAHPSNHHPHHVPRGHPQYAAPQPHYPPPNAAPGMGLSHSAPLPLPPPHRTDSRTAYTIPYWGPAERGRSLTQHAIHEEDERSRSMPRSSSQHRSRSRPGHHSDASSWYHEQSSHGHTRNRTVSFSSGHTYLNSQGEEVVHIPPSPRSGHVSISPTSTKHSHNAYGSIHQTHSHPEKKGLLQRIHGFFENRDNDDWQGEETRRRLVKRHHATVHD
ncbi:hypothetical protein NEOLEDRAFT_1134643 [Neolentinus lepideus HHB14362 ss-1]|uniref:Uncharacterized protein n=1 Tax=Neolentinus lepideus HHB14362 ss-1 TaxID=1314782 RepID=A0A165S3G6_9AGAM|nr:hypothetical protein NEOLEDRAFT_1134643 [Neolentinus lepideus HHB14362 ss-1]